MSKTEINWDLGTVLVVVGMGLAFAIAYALTAFILIQEIAPLP